MGKTKPLGATRPLQRKHGIFVVSKTAVSAMLTIQAQRRAAKDIMSDAIVVHHARRVSEACWSGRDYIDTPNGKGVAL